MRTTERVTVTLPADLVRRIDLLEKNRSRFITRAVEEELERRRRDALRESLAHPHPESLELAEVGLGEWSSSLPPGDEDLVDFAAGRPVRWVPERGWVEDGE